MRGDRPYSPEALREERKLSQECLARDPRIRRSPDGFAIETGGYSVGAVENRITETRTGFQRRQPEHRIDQADLWDGLADVRAVAEKEVRRWRSELAISRSVGEKPRVGHTH